MNNLFMHTTVDRAGAYFQFLAMINSVVMEIYSYFCNVKMHFCLVFVLEWNFLDHRHAHA